MSTAKAYAYVAAEVLPEVQITAQAEALTLTLPQGWLEHHPLMRAELEQEVQYQQQTGWELIIKEAAERVNMTAKCVIFAQQPAAKSQKNGLLK